MLAFPADRIVQRRQVALVSARAVPSSPSLARRDWGLFAFCAVVGGLILALLAMAAWASFVKRWPYNLSLTLENYAFGDFDTNGWHAYWNSVVLASWTAVVGTRRRLPGRVPAGEDARLRVGPRHRPVDGDAAMAVPGLVLGLAYIFFFNALGNPLGFIYATMIILVVNSITHFYTVGHLTAPPR